MKLINRVTDLESLNRKALKIARKYADETGTLMAGNLCNTNAYNPQKANNKDVVKAMFKVRSRFLENPNVSPPISGLRWRNHGALGLEVTKSDRATRDNHTKI